MSETLAVVSQSGATVSFFDTDDYRLLGVTEVTAEPHELCFDPVNRLLWVSVPYKGGFYGNHTGHQSELVVIDPDTRRVVDTVDISPECGPHGLSLDAERGLLYVSVEEGGTYGGGVVVVDTASRKPVHRIGTGAPGPHWFEISPDGRTGYATNKEAPFVSVVDIDRAEMVGRIEVPGSENLAVTDTKLYVAAPWGGAPDSAHAGIRVFDRSTHELLKVLPTDQPLIPVHHTASGKLLVGEMRLPTGSTSLLGGQAPGRMQVFDTETDTWQGEAEIGHLPMTIRSSLDGSRGYAACVVSSTVDVIDLSTLERITRLEIPSTGAAGAHGLASIPAA
ncbi:YncE family protein [Pseudonocardiaceae bacterium YIM PH 21723]|nr:YncE family protein [Pseudonocardiaceae bacterium YIM PH 21723]